MSRTRVGLICGYLDPKRDGVADYTRRLVPHLSRCGFEPLLVTTHEWAQAAGAANGAVGVTDRWDFRGVAAAARALPRLDLDLVHVQFAPSVFGHSRAIGLLPLFLRDSVPLIVTLHEYGVWSAQGRRSTERSALWSAVERRGYADRETLLLAPRAAALLAASPEQLAVLRARFRRRMPARHVPIGPNVEIAPADSDTQARADVRRELTAAPNAPLIAFFGFLHPEKGLDRLIAAVAALRGRHPAVHLLLIGGSESHSVPSAAAHDLRRQLQQVAEALDMQDRVHFTGYLPESDVSRLLQTADVAAFPFNAGVTRKSSSLLAALAAGVPVLATAPPGQLRAPTEADGVLRVPPHDTSALAAGLDRILSDPVVASRLTAAGRVVAASQSWEAISASHADVYTRALAARRDGHSWTEAEEPSRVGTSTGRERGGSVAS